MLNAKDIIVSAIVSALTALVVVGLVSMVGHGGAKFGAASSVGSTNIPVVIAGGSQPSAVNALYVGESFYTDGILYASSTSLLTGTTTAFAGVQVGTKGTPLNAIQSGTCTGITYASLATSTPIDCAVTNALPSDTNVLMWIPKAASNNSAFNFSITGSTGSTTAGYITGVIFQIGNTTGNFGLNSTSSYPLATTSIRYIIFR